MNRSLKMTLTVLALILVVLMIFSFAACAANPKEEPSAPAPEEPAPAPAEPEPTPAEDPTPSEEPAASEEAPAGILSAFSASDLDGNDADASVFSDYDLTVVNIWATFCGPCIQEMPALAALAEEYADKGVQFVGIVSDVLDSDGAPDESQLALARDIVSQTGVGYRNLIPSESLTNLLSQVTAVPTTLFVDKNGAQVGYAQIGSLNEDGWRAAIDEALESLQ